jgi:type I restriction enzyme S subunit
MSLTLDAACLAIVDCEHKTAPIDPAGDYFAVGTPAMRGNRIDYEQARRISYETYAEWTRRLKPADGDLLLAREAPVGLVVRIPRDLRVAPGQRTVLLRPNPALLDPGYAFYLLSAPQTQARLLQKAEGSTVAHLNVADVRALVLPDLPPVDVQHAVAATLGALDEKIESNRRITRLCLDLAEAIYLRACEAGSDRVALKDAGQWLSGGTPSTSQADYWGGDLPWISSASLKDFFISDSERRLTESGAAAATNIVPRGSVIFVVRGMSLKTEFRVGLTQVSVAFGQDCKAILPTIPAATLAVALWASRARILELVDEAGHGTGRLPTDLLERFPLSVPRDESLADTLAVLVERGARAMNESRSIERLRDTLLPEIMAGRISPLGGAGSADQALSRGA